MAKKKKSKKKKKKKVEEKGPKKPKWYTKLHFRIRFMTLCHLFSLQMGSVILNTIGFVLMVIAGMINFYAPNHTIEDTTICQYVTLYLTSSTIFFGHICNFFAAFWEHIDLTLCGTNLLAAGFIIWLILCVFGFYHSKKYPFYMWVCVSGVRCPDVLWMFDARWRFTGFDCPPEDLIRAWPNVGPSLEEEMSKMSIMSVNRTTNNSMNIINNASNINFMNIANTNVTLFQNEIVESMFPGCDVDRIELIALSGVLCALYSIFMVITILVGISYRQELIEANIIWLELAMDP